MRGLQRQRPRDIDPLPLAAGQFVRIAVGEQHRVEAYRLQQLHRPLQGGRLGQPMNERTEGDRHRNRQPRVQGGIGVLEHHLHLPVQIAVAEAIRRPDRQPIEDDAAAVERDEVHQKPGRRRLAAAGLPHDAKGFALLHVEGHIVDGLHDGLGPVQQASLEDEMLGQVLNRQHWSWRGEPRTLADAVRGASGSARGSIRRIGPNRSWVCRLVHSRTSMA